MRNMGKANSVKATKEIRKFLMGLGAIEMTNKPAWGEPMYEGKYALGMTMTQPNSFIMETGVGLLWLRIDCRPDSSLYTVFGRFDEVDKAVELFGKDLRLNHYSGKFNFHYTNLNDMMLSLRMDLVSLIPEKRTNVITTFTEIEQLGENTYDAEKIFFICNGEVMQGKRVCIDDAKLWKDEFKNWKGKKVVMVDAVACLISKSSEFQIIIDGKLKKVS